MISLDPTTISLMETNEDHGSAQLDAVVRAMTEKQLHNMLEFLSRPDASGIRETDDDGLLLVRHMAYLGFVASLRRIGGGEYPGKETHNG